MKKNKRKVIFLLDETRSMESRKAETLSGYKAFLKRQKRENPELPFTLVLFNSYQIKVVTKDTPMKSVKNLTEKIYKPSHLTPLWDAIGKALEEHTSQGTGLLVVCTDGEENCSTSYSKEQILNKIESKKQDGWEFLYLGVDLNNADGGYSIGIDNSHIAAADMGSNFRNLSKTVSLYSSTGKVQYNND